MNEIYKDLPGYEGRYQVSNLGNVKRLSYTKIMRNQVTSWEKEMPELVLKASVNSDGYLQLTLCNPTRVARVHRLVAETFLPPPSEELLKECLKAGYSVSLINHKDFNKLNNNVENLEWCTPAYNATERDPSWVTKVQGENSSHAILTEKAVKEIVFALQNKTHTQIELALLYSVKQITISNIWTGRSWNSVTGFPIKQRSYKKKEQSLKLSES